MTDLARDDRHADELVHHREPLHQIREVVAAAQDLQLENGERARLRVRET